MKKIVFIIANVLLYASVYVSLCYLDPRFKYYFWFPQHEYQAYTPNSTHFKLAVCFAIISFAVFTIYVWTWKGGREKSLILKLKRMDYASFSYFTLVLLWFLVGTLFNINLGGGSWLLRNVFVFQMHSPLYLLFVPPLAFLLGMAFYAVTLLHIRDKSFRQSLRWLAFFKENPITKPLGCILLVSLVGNAVAPFWLVVFINWTYPMAKDFAIAFALFNILSLFYLRHYIQNLSESYEKAAYKTLQSERLKTELIANVSHDLRTPLTSIVNYVDLIGKLPIKDDDLTEYVDVLSKSTSRLRQLIDDLMDASKAGTGNLPVQLQTMDFMELLGQVEGEFDKAFADKDLTLVRGVPEGPVEVYADGKHLWRVMVNLFGNAAKYSMPRTRIYADVKREGDAVIFSMKNVSFDPLNLTPEELMEQFTRGDHSRHTQGSGLGLNIASSLAGLMGGRLTLAIHGDLFEARLELRIPKP